jgi:hypothetical protein
VFVDADGARRGGVPLLLLLGGEVEATEALVAVVVVAVVALVIAE